MDGSRPTSTGQVVCRQVPDRRLDVMKAMARKNRSRTPATCILIMRRAPRSRPTWFSTRICDNEMGRRLELADPNLFAFAFVVEFPLFAWNEDQKRWDAEHHRVHHAPRRPDTSSFSIQRPRQGHSPEAYDLVCQRAGSLLSGSIRVHQKRAAGEKACEVLGYTERSDRGALRSSFWRPLTTARSTSRGDGSRNRPARHGAAPAPTISGRSIAFPKTQTGVDPLFDAPDIVDDDQLRDLRIMLTE